MQDVGHFVLYLHVAQSTASITRSSCTSELSPANDKDAELNRQLPFGIDLNETLPDLLKLRTEAEKSDIQFSQPIPYRSVDAKSPKAQSDSKLYS